ncbi:MAG: hypothetical protein ACM30G_06040 [Micromonosporaceae bacterium]
MNARVRAMIGATVLALLGGLTLAGCARGGGVGTAGDYSDLSLEGQALQAIGFSPNDMVPVASFADATPQPSVSGKPERPFPPGVRHKRLRFAFGQRMLHGEAVVQTDQGPRTVVVQRGTVTEITSTSVTVKSADGFTLTWTFGDPIHVVEHRTSVQPSAVAVGAQVGIAGTKDGNTPIARLIVIPGPKPART